MNIEGLKELSKIDLTRFVVNEQNVKYNIVIPFLNYFGYNTLDLEHAAQGSRIDINIGNKIIIETKALNKNLDEYVNQVEKYCNAERPNLAILTNGKYYRFYSPFMRVSSFSDTLIYKFSLSDFSNDEVIERITKIIGADNYKNDTYLNYIEERENEITQIKDLLKDYENKKLSNIEVIQKEIIQLKSERTKLESEIGLKQKEIEQIESKKIPEKEELYGKHFIPRSKPTSRLQPLPKPPRAPKPSIHVSELEGLEMFLDSKVDRTMINAKGIIIGKGIKVYKNSYAAIRHTENLKYASLREELINNDILHTQNNKLVFSKDYLFDAFSAAASVVCGNSRNGKDYWKDKNGLSINDIEKSIRHN